MKYKIDDKVRYIGGPDFGYEYGKVYIVYDTNNNRVWATNSLNEKWGMPESCFEPAELGEKKMNNELNTDDKLALMKIVLKEFSELQNSLYELTGQQKKNCLVSMMRMNELLEKLGE